MPLACFKTLFRHFVVRGTANAVQGERYFIPDFLVGYTLKVGVRVFIVLFDESELHHMLVSFFDAYHRRHSKCLVPFIGAVC
mmetsp:Transcript_50522/g.142022  ORF Transcript_50522/g.142022 Transcript_50522/m.142022 type:complete len:82 (+) Transcript_50522:300-545(+)